MSHRFRVPVHLNVQVDDLERLVRMAFEDAAFDNEDVQANWFANDPHMDEPNPIPNTSSAIYAALSWLLDRALKDPQVKAQADTWSVTGRDMGPVQDEGHADTWTILLADQEAGVTDRE